MTSSDPHQKGRAPVIGVRRTQVFDLPEPAGFHVTEHRYERVRCTDCRQATTAP
ncbi:IS66 family transposase zinc-finger binding domain-containing protein, partial [Nocardiopsis rhodophaea]|uniref:IS66 family transposase zinc-finger binding domain-containing protein n=1 Tax=Nocardiopsis rhodophaea TaxID=280238 RepID=UPI00399D2908